jgi:hypothetical protein
VTWEPSNGIKKTFNKLVRWPVGRDASGEIILLIVDSRERYFLAVGAIFWTFYLVAPAG